MKRDFVVTCTYEKEYLVRSIINNFHKRRSAQKKEVCDGNTNIRFRCTRNKLTECRLILGRMLNEGMLLNVEETW